MQNLGRLEWYILHYPALVGVERRDGVYCEVCASRMATGGTNSGVVCLVEILQRCFEASTNDDSAASTYVDNTGLA